MSQTNILKAFELAKESYSQRGIDVMAAIAKADSIGVSMHCWQGDDVLGFDGTGSLTGGIQTTGNYPGRARNAEELRTDIKKALELIPGKTKVNLHGMYPEFGNNPRVDRDAYTIDHFQNWVDFAKENKLGLDFNPSFFSHPMMDGDFSLSSFNKDKRTFWVEHGKRCREISAEIGKQLGEVCVDNFWMPDGYKDVTANTLAHRELMIQSLDEIFKVDFDKAHTLDAVESKLFGVGVESYTVANHEFSFAYALTHNKLYTLDSGHFHPTEVISAKISSTLCFMDQVLLHVSRGVRWDSDHVITLDDELQAIMNEIVRNGYEKRVHIGLDYFDASINRIACWAIGMRNARKALLRACLDPVADVNKAEMLGDYTSRLALLEENKTLPFGAIWDYYCLTSEKPVGTAWLDEVKKYETDVLLKRS